MEHGRPDTPGMTDEARREWAVRRFNQEMAVEARREWEATLPDIERDTHKRVEGVTVGDDIAEVEEYAVEEVKAREWVNNIDGKPPSSATGLQKAADKAGYATTASWSHQERRGSHGRLLKPPEADVCSVIGVRGDEKFLASWEAVLNEKTDKWSWKSRDVMAWAPHQPINPTMTTVTVLRKEYFT